MTIITRSALVAWGRKPPPELHHIEIAGQGGPRKIVTWAEVMEQRRKRQAERLQLIRQANELRAYRVWVAYYDQWLMGGWQAFIDRDNDVFGTWVCRARMAWLIPPLMEAFPLVLPLGSEADQWAAWKIAFAKQYKRNTHDRRPRGVAYVWWDGHGKPVPIKAKRRLAA